MKCDHIGRVLLIVASTNEGTHFIIYYFFLFFIIIYILYYYFTFTFYIYYFTFYLLFFTVKILSTLQIKFMAIQLWKSDKNGWRGFPRKWWVMGENTGDSLEFRTSFYIRISRNDVRSGKNFRANFCTSELLLYNFVIVSIYF